MAATPATQRMKNMRDRQAKLKRTRRDYYATAEEHAFLTKCLEDKRNKEK